jgi:hypothetical protein
MEPFGALLTEVVDATNPRKYGRPVGTRTPDRYRVKVARIGFTTTYKTAGTAKVRGSRTRHTFCGLGFGLEI